MTDTHWRLLADLLADGATPSTLPTSLSGVLAERLEEALAAPNRAELDAFKAALAEFFVGLLQRAPESAVAAARGSADALPAESAAYWLGQIAFAQEAAAQAAERRADDRFADVFTSTVLLAYVRALAQSDHTGRELAAALGVREETVSRNLSELRELGVVDYRRDGTRLYNFLTPAARSAFEALETPEALPHRDPVKLRLLKRRQENTSEAFQTWPTLSNVAVLGH